MKSLFNLCGTIGLVAVLSCGCQPSDNTPSENGSESEAPKTQGQTLQETVTTTTETAKEVVTEVEKTVVEAAESATQLVTEGSAKAQELLQQAQALIGEKKYQEAGALLQKLADANLTPEQQQMLDNLTQKIQTAMESEAVKEGTKAIGNLLGGEK